MELKHKRFYILFLLWSLCLFALSGWWIYLLFTFESDLTRLYQTNPEFFHGKNIVFMLKWEGGFFMLSLLILSNAFFYFFVKDRKVMQELQVFFASLTHELKTPLASIRLQAEVLDELIASSDNQTHQKLTSRMVEDALKLETQMDKILQLSRLERGGNLNIKPVEVVPMMKSIIKTWASDQDVEFNFEETVVMADAFALELVLRNLFENSKRHANGNPIKVDLKSNGQLVYNDGGVYRGDVEKLGQLFYKHDSAKGSGIGVYLIKRLCQKMNATVMIKTEPCFHYQFKFPIDQEKQS